MNHQQRTFLPDWEKTEKDHETRHSLINQVPATNRVKALLHILADFPRTMLGTDAHVTVSIGEIQQRLARTDGTVKNYIREARQTAFLEVIGSNHCKNTYVIHWLAIVNRDESTKPLPRQAGCTAVESETLSQAGCTSADDDSYGSIRAPGGGQIPDGRGANPDPEGVKFDGRGGQIWGANSTFAPLSLKPEEPVLLVDVSKEPVKPVFAPGGQKREQLPAEIPRANIAKWRMAIASRDLSQAEVAEELYTIAVRLRILPASDINRINLFTQAAVDVRLLRERPWYVHRGERKHRKAGDIFRENVLYRRWSYRQDRDVDAAREMIRRVDLHKPGATGTREEKVASIQAEIERKRKLREQGVEA